LFAFNKYTKRLGFVAVQVENETEIWHILSVRKTLEAKHSRNISGMTAHTNSGDKFYRKELINMSGNVSEDFLKQLQKCQVHYKEVDILSIICINLQVSECAVTLEKRT
jgi:hypothetical protein